MRAALRSMSPRQARGARLASLAMIDDREIWACANLLLKQHGENAWFVVARRADELLAQGEVEGRRTFLRILARIKELETSNPGGQLH
jgi:hypothetical protein